MACVTWCERGVEGLERGAWKKKIPKWFLHVAVVANCCCMLWLYLLLHVVVLCCCKIFAFCLQLTWQGGGCA